MTPPGPPADQGLPQSQGAAFRGSDVAPLPTAATTQSYKKRRLVEALITFVLTSLFCVGWFAYQNMHDMVESERWEAHTHRVIQELGDLLSSLKDAETGQRGFIITGEQSFLEPYETSLALVSTRLADLRRLTADNPQQQQRLAAITPLVAAKLLELKETMALRETQGFTAASQAVMAHLGKSLMDQIRVLAVQAQNEEEQLLKDRTAIREEDTRQTIRSILLGVALGSLALLLLFIYLRWELASRRRADLARQASEERYRSLFNSIDEGFCIIEMIFETPDKPIDYRFLEVNPAFERQAGIPGAVGQRMRQLVPDHEAYWFENFGQVALTGVSHCFINEAKAMGNRWFDVCAFRLGGMESARIAVLFRDITEHRRAREEILRLNAELEERVRQRTAQLQAANQELESFSYSVSHDLRSPLGTIDGFTHLLEKTLGDKAGENAKHHLNRIRTSTRQMSDLIDGLLALAQLSRNKLQVEIVDLSVIARRIAQECQEQEPGRQVQMHIQDSMLTQGDPQLLSVVVQNLLGNAWKFTSKRALAHIEMGSEAGEAEEADQTVYFVKDNGAGFDMTHAEKLFGTFERFHAASDFAGTGIGLATVKRVINRHEGRVWAKGKENEGATFYFTLRQEAESGTGARR